MVQHADMENDLAVLVAGVSLISHSHLAVAFVGTGEIAGCYRVGESKKAVWSPGDERSRSRFRRCS